MMELFGPNESPNMSTWGKLTRGSAAFLKEVMFRYRAEDVELVDRLTGGAGDRNSKWPVTFKGPRLFNDMCWDSEL